MQIRNNRDVSIGIRSSAYRVPSGSIPVKQLMEENKEYCTYIREEVLRIPKLRTLTLEEIGSVPRFSDEEPGELLLSSIREMLEKENVRGEDISLILDFSTCSRDRNGISLCYKVQHEIGADNAITIALGNGSCASLQLAFKMATSLMRTEKCMKYAILIAEDRVEGNRYHPPAHVLGDGASALLLEKDSTHSLLLETLYLAIGRFSNIMGVNHQDIDNYDMGEFENRVIPMHYKVISDLLSDILKNNNLQMGQIDLFLYQNMCQNDYMGLINMLGIDEDKVFQGGLKGHGHILASDLVVNYHLAEKKGRLFPGANVLLISSGAGFSWGATLLKK